MTCHRLLSPFRSAGAVNKQPPSAVAERTSTLTTIRDEINRLLDKREAKGWATYGKSLEEANDGRDWNHELICELLDALQYAAKEIHDLREQLKTPFDA